MRKRGLIILGVVLVLASLQSCSSKPEQNLLKSYFNAISMNDVTTMSTMAVDPIKIDFASWKVVPSARKRSSRRHSRAQRQGARPQEAGRTARRPDARRQGRPGRGEDDFNSARSGAARAAAKAKMDAAS